MSSDMIYYGIKVNLPNSESEDYGNFVTNLNNVGQGDRPTEFEKRLLDDWVLDGASWEGWRKTVSLTEVGYHFEDHLTGLCLEEMALITKAAVELGAEQFTFLGSSRRSRKEREASETG